MMSQNTPKLHTAKGRRSDRRRRVLPLMNGYGAASAIRNFDRADAQTIPIVALTANAFTSDAAKARSIGMNDHLAKPIEINSLLETLRKWVL